MADFYPDEEIEGLTRAKRRALYLLGNRSYCTAELKKSLLRNYSEEITDSVIQYVNESGYLDDEEYAKRMAKRIILGKHYGKRRARYDMLLKGLDEEYVDGALSEYNDDDIKEEITELIRRKYSDRLSEYAERQKVIAALARRGYSYGDIKECIDGLAQSDDERDDYNPDYDENEEW